MRPTQSDVHVNRPLSNILVAYMQDDSKAISKSVFPVVPVAHKTDSYYKWKRDDFFRISAAERAPGSPSEGGGFDLETDTYNCKEYAIHKDLEDAVVDNADTELDLEEAATRYVGQQLLLKRESVFNSTFITTGIWTGSSTGSDLTGVAGAPGAGQVKQWDQATSTPIEDLRSQIVAMEEKTGYRPNTLLVGPYVWKALEDHPELIDRIKFTQKGVVTKDLLAGLLGIDRIVVGSMAYNSAVEGRTASYSFIHGKFALLCYTAARPSLMEPSAGYIFSWTKRPGAGPEGQRIKRFRIEEREVWRIEGQMNFAMKQVCADLGAYFTTVVA